MPYFKPGQLLIFQFLSSLGKNIKRQFQVFAKKKYFLKGNANLANQCLELATSGVKIAYQLGSEFQKAKKQ